MISTSSTLRPDRGAAVGRFPQVTTGWQPDPTGRHEFRYHNGSAWTADVSDGGQRFVDPLIPTRQRNVPATVSLVFGAVSLALSPLPFVFVVGGLAAVSALVLGWVGLKRSRPTGLGRSRAIAGLLTGGTGLLAVGLGVFLTVELSDAVDLYENPGEFEVGEVACTSDGSAWTAEGTIENRSDEQRSYLLTVEFVRSGTDNAQVRTRVEVNDVAAGTSATFEVRRQVQLDEVECRVTDVDGPAPFGIDVNG